MLPSIAFACAVLLAMASGLPALLGKDRETWLGGGMLGLSGLLGLTLALWILHRGEPWSLGHPALRLDPAGALLLLPVSLVAPLLAWYGSAYWHVDEKASAGRLRFFFGAAAGLLQFIAAAQHAILFLIAWELLALIGFLMVCTEDHLDSARQAGWVYLVAAHAGVLGLFAGFGILSGVWGSFTFGPLPMGFAHTPAGTLAFLLLLAAFGMKAGLAPLHIWLPGAHAVAPSHVSALLSGLMLKIGILGLCRLILWVPDPPLWWGGLLAGLGSASAVLGLAFALGQRDLKRVLAYSSIENVGIIALGLGLALAGKALARPDLVLLGLAGAAFHTINHALFKPLLFMGAGSLLHATGTRDLESMGGLLKAMPWTGTLMLLGGTALSGLPPFNGFASEWLLYLGSLQAVAGKAWIWGAALVIALALAGGLAVATFARALGIALLGEPRSEAATKAHEAPAAMRHPMLVLAILCTLLGLVPVLLSPALTRLARFLAPGMDLPSLSTEAHLGVLSLVGMAGLLFAFAGWMKLRTLRSRREVTWDCGYAAPTARMQYTASSFGQMLVDAIAFLLWPVRRLPRVVGLFPRRTRYESALPDPVLDRTLTPAMTRIGDWAARLRTLQSGHLNLYLLYVVLTLLALFAWTLA